MAAPEPVEAGVRGPEEQRTVGGRSGQPGSDDPVDQQRSDRAPIRCARRCSPPTARCTVAPARSRR
ncbi:hypothetical protein [Tsukamurella sp. PLM1]|uniref:hypothetical protein n=1 Tax=Tsukamurella sp. PLM1 TaxID=2929795 RepID=UPI0020BDEECA|nr:hypothetical protein [Tsukamurella sp. PLM1]